MYSVNLVVFWPVDFFGQGGCIRAMWISSSKCFYSGKVVLFGQGGCVRAKWLYLGKSGCILAKWFVYWQKLLFSGKVDAFE